MALRTAVPNTLLYSTVHHSSCTVHKRVGGRSVVCAAGGAQGLLRRNHCSSSSHVIGARRTAGCCGHAGKRDVKRCGPHVGSELNLKRLVCAVGSRCVIVAPPPVRGQERRWENKPVLGSFFKVGRNHDMEGGAYRRVKPFKGAQEWPKLF